MFGKLFKKTDYAQLFNNGAILLDVRNPNEIAADSIKGSKNIPLPQLAESVKALKALKKPIVCVCASGIRSGVAKSQLKGYGIEAYNGGSYTKMKKYFV